MAVQIIITGDHATDALAELQNIAVAMTGGAPEPVKNVAGGTKPQNVSTASAPSTQAPAKSTSTAAPASGGATDNKLSREEQDAAVAAMVDAGEKDERYDLLTKGRQKAVDDGIAAKATAGSTEEDLDDMFGDEDKPAEEVANADTVRDLMGKLGKDAEGNPIQENLLKIRDILTKYVTKGKDIKVGNIPEAKFKEVVAELKKIAA